MPKTTTTTVNRNEEGQYQVTVPKVLGDALELDGTQVEWKIDSGRALRMEVADE